jgi:hypothetical protein
VIEHSIIKGQTRDHLEDLGIGGNHGVMKLGFHKCGMFLDSFIWELDRMWILCELNG